METKQIATVAASVCAIGLVFGGGYYMLFHDKKDSPAKSGTDDNSSNPTTPKADGQGGETETKNTEENKGGEQAGDKGKASGDTSAGTPGTTNETPAAPAQDAKGDSNAKDGGKPAAG